LQKKSEMHFYAVNYFANTDFFDEIRPSYYFLIDPVFWRTDINEDIKANNKKLIKNLLAADWNINLICREGGYDIVKNLFKSNPNLVVTTMKSNWYDFRSKKANIFAMRFRLSSPNFVNVLIAAIWHALISGRKNIKIYGADFSSFKELKVDQDTNLVYTSSSHFYKESYDLISVKEKYIGVGPKMINIRFYQIWLGFRQMYFLAQVAEAWGASIKNKSSFSYLDCFDRK